MRGRGSWFLIQLNYIGRFIQTEPKIGETNKILYLAFQAFTQECDCDFLTSGTGVIDPIVLEKLRKEQLY